MKNACLMMHFEKFNHEETAKTALIYSLHCDTKDGIQTISA
jgi:hypothetical protein